MTKEKIVICCDCRSYIPSNLYCPGPRCAASRSDYVGYSGLSFAYCQNVNTDGHCDMFRPALPKPVPVPWWKKLFGGSRGQL